VLLFLVIVTGCKTEQHASSPQIPAEVTNQIASAGGTNEEILQEGDSLRVSFPGAANLNTEVRVRLDGIISLPIVGEVKAAGRTPKDLEQELLKLYGPSLQTKEVAVTVLSSALYVYVTGAVLRPGKITSDHPMNALDAIMEAGGFDYAKANLKNVRVIRRENGQTQYYLLNFKRVLHGEQDQHLELNRGDIIYVPERFAWF
jgi:polysaccharide export outer membrane protein